MEDKNDKCFCGQDTDENSMFCKDCIEQRENDIITILNLEEEARQHQDDAIKVLYEGK